MLPSPQNTGFVRIAVQGVLPNPPQSGEFVAKLVARDRSPPRALFVLLHAEPGLSGTSAACRGNSDRVLAVDHMTLIDVRPGVRSGKPCFRGTRITVYDVLEYLAGGMSADDIVADFPELTLAHVRAALSFAALRERRLAASA